MPTKTAPKMPINAPKPWPMPEKMPRRFTGITLPIMVYQAGVATPAPNAVKAMTAYTISSVRLGEVSASSPIASAKKK